MSDLSTELDDRGLDADDLALALGVGTRRAYQILAGGASTLSAEQLGHLVPLLGRESVRRLSASVVVREVGRPPTRQSARRHATAVLRFARRAGLDDVERIMSDVVARLVDEPAEDRRQLSILERA